MYVLKEIGESINYNPDSFFAQASIYAAGIINLIYMFLPVVATEGKEPGRRERVRELESDLTNS